MLQVRPTLAFSGNAKRRPLQGVVGRARRLRSRPPSDPQRIPNRQSERDIIKQTEVFDIEAILRTFPNASQAEVRIGGVIQLREGIPSGGSPTNPRRRV